MEQAGSFDGSLHDVFGTEEDVRDDVLPPLVGFSADQSLAAHRLAWQQNRENEQREVKVLNGNHPQHMDHWSSGCGQSARMSSHQTSYTIREQGPDFPHMSTSAIPAMPPTGNCRVRGHGSVASGCSSAQAGALQREQCPPFGCGHRQHQSLTGQPHQAYQYQQQQQPPLYHFTDKRLPSGPGALGMAPGVAPLPAYPQHQSMHQSQLTGYPAHQSQLTGYPAHQPQPMSHQAYPYQQQQRPSHHHTTGWHSQSGQGVLNVASASVPLSRLHDARSPHDARRPDLPMPHDASYPWPTSPAGAPAANVHGSHTKRDVGQADFKLTPSAPKRVPLCVRPLPLNWRRLGVGRRRSAAGGGRCGEATDWLPVGWRHCGLIALC